jgi:hypothetical protein
MPPPIPTLPYPQPPAPSSPPSPGVAGDEEGITAEEEAALAAFMPPKEAQGPAAGGQKSLAELILSRIRDNQRQQGIEGLAE